LSQILVVTFRMGSLFRMSLLFLHVLGQYVESPTHVVGGK